jgi:hypothetical protein
MEYTNFRNRFFVILISLSSIYTSIYCRNKNIVAKFEIPAIYVNILFRLKVGAINSSPRIRSNNPMSKTRVTEFIPKKCDDSQAQRAHVVSQQYNACT